MSRFWGLFGLILFCTVLTGLTCAEPVVGQGEQPLTVGTEENSAGDVTTGALLLQERIENLTAFVKKGIEFAKSNSKEDVLIAFNDENGEFFRGEEYIFAYDLNGTTLAYPLDPTLLGTDRSNLSDSNGAMILQTMKSIASHGGGYLYYVYPNPAENMTEQVKFSYVEPVDDSWFIGSGFYIPGINGLLEKDAIEGLKARVLKAATFGEEEGKEKAVEALNDLNGTWAKDNTYIYAYDYNGTVLVMPFIPDVIGLNRMDMTDKYGSPIFRLGIENAKEGGGFNYLVYNNPGSGKDEMKFCYVLPVGDDWMVGSGIYFGKDLA